MVGRIDMERKENYYNRNGWRAVAREVREGLREKMEMKLISREREKQRQGEENRILKAKYNKRYKDINVYGLVIKISYM